ARSRKHAASSSGASVAQQRCQRTRSDARSAPSSISSAARLIATFSCGIYAGAIADIPASDRFPAWHRRVRRWRQAERLSFLLSLEMGAQLNHRLVMGAAYGLRIDAKRGGDFRNLHLAIIQHRQN